MLTPLHHPRRLRQRSAALSAAAVVMLAACGSGDGTDGSSAEGESSKDSDEAVTGEDGGDGSPIDVVDDSDGPDDPLYDSFFDDPVDPTEPSIDGIKLFFDTEFPNASWRPQLGAFGWGEDDSGFEVEVGGANVEDVAIEICDGLLKYASSLRDNGRAEVSTYVPNESGGVGDQTVVAIGTIADGCTTA